MRIIFFGTPDYVLPVLEELHKNYEVVAVVTQEPKPAGRDKKLEFSAVDTWAFKHKIEKHFDLINLPKADLGVCASFGKIIPSSVINRFKFGILNIHPSLLPKYRGASPIQTAIANGDTQTGLTVIKMDQKMDHGKIVSYFKDEILPNDTFETLRTRLFEKSAEFLMDLIPNYIKNKINLKTQNDEDATFTEMVTKQDGFVDLDNDGPREIYNKFRAYQPWPGIWTNVQITNNKLQATRRLRILNLSFDPVTSHLSLITVQLEGKKPVSWKEFEKAYIKTISK